MPGRFPRFAARVLLACLPVAGLATGIGAGSASAAPAPASTRAATLAALEHLLKGVRSTDHAIPGLATRSRSGNWSGYADTRTKFTKVAATWTEPAVKCGSAQSLAAFWVGIDGFSNNTVEQDGTLAFCRGGHPTYYTWWEMFPSNNIQVVGSTVRPGDHIAASVVRAGTRYTLKVTDSTRGGNNVRKTETCAATRCHDSSAEWIAEAPTSNGSIVPLPNFRTWTVKNAAVSGGGRRGTISSFAHTAITMVDAKGRVKARPSSLSAGGSEFKVTWKAST
jgi:hypothetical protein